MEGEISRTTKIRVRYSETDKMGIVYYGNYLTYFEVGRTEFVRSFGKAYSAFEAEGFILPVLEAHVKYIGSAAYDEELTIETRLIDFTRVRLHFEYEIRRADGTLIASGYTKHCWADENGKPRRISTEMRNFLRNMNEA